jgi:hypothetical protein
MSTGHGAIENGVIQYPVEEITIAGNMKDMFQQIVSIGNDVLTRGNKSTGSILIEKMVIAGSCGASSTRTEGSVGCPFFRPASDEAA